MFEITRRAYGNVVDLGRAKSVNTAVARPLIHPRMLDCWIPRKRRR